jgi:hypothetical protein
MQFSNILTLLFDVFVASSLLLSFRYSVILFLHVCSIHVLCNPNQHRIFGLDPVTTVIWLVSIDVIVSYISLKCDLSSKWCFCHRHTFLEAANRRNFLILKLYKICALFVYSLVVCP